MDQLVDNALSKAEIRHLRDRLNAITLNLDVFMMLPNDLFLYMIPFLDLQGFLAARSVSRAWNRRFSSSDVCMAVLKENFRYRWETEYNSLAGRDQELASGALSRWVLGAAAKRLRRLNYQCRSWKAFTHADVNKYPYEWSVNLMATYNNGRVAFMLGSDAILIYTLGVDGPPRIFRKPNRTMIHNWVLLENYLITDYDE